MAPVPPASRIRTISASRRETPPALAPTHRDIEGFVEVGLSPTLSRDVLGMVTPGVVGGGIGEDDDGDPLPIVGREGLEVDESRHRRGQGQHSLGQGQVIRLSAGPKARPELGDDPFRRVPSGHRTIVHQLPGCRGVHLLPHLGIQGTGPIPGPPPGWYPDPAGGGGSRWWDGTTWTGYTNPVPPVGAHPALVAATQEAAASPWALRAGVGLGAAAVLGGLVFVAHAAFLHQFVDWYHRVVSAAQRGLPAPNPPVLPMSISLWLLPLDLLSIGSQILLLIWQYRAARAARFLGYPARHRPGWGVAFWFIPIANLFCPYQAIADCLPRGSPERGAVLRMWLSLLAAQWAITASVITAFFSQGASLIVLVIAAALWLYFLANLDPVVSSIRRDHLGAVGVPLAR